MNKSDAGALAAYNLRKDLAIDIKQPVNLDVVTERLSIRVTYRDLGAGIEGACKSLGAKRLVVLKPNLESIQKERFTLAHEIGHLLIHHNSYLCKSDFFSTYRTQNEKEQEANDFAAELLLPQKAVVNILGKHDLTFSLIQKVADTYQTSISVAAIRLMQLFQDDAVLLFHDGTRIIWKVRSDNCFQKISNTISDFALAHTTNMETRNAKGTIEALHWLDNDVEDLLCEEETHYFVRMHKYLTILKFYYN